MATSAERYYNPLMGILQNEGKVAPFIDVILGFLYRRTDFFRIMKTETDKLGFPPGVALKLLVNIFKKYESLAEKDQIRIEELKKSREPSGAQPTASKASKPPAAADNERGQEEPSSSSQHTAGMELREGTAASEERETNTASDGVKMEVDSKEEETTSASTKTQAKSENYAAAKEKVTAEAICVESKSNDIGKEVDPEEEKEDPEQARKRRELQDNPLTYNGAECDAYYWSQNITEADIRVKVPKTIFKGRQVKVDISKKHIKVSCQVGSEWTQLVCGELEWEVKQDDSMWTLSPGEFVHINLEKRQERWWERVFLGEAGINTRKIDCSRPMTDLDDEAQAKIEEMMHNQRQKQLGLPQSHEMKTHEMLRKAWDAEGSPFKGQPFDPSKFTIDPSGTATFSGAGV